MNKINKLIIIVFALALMALGYYYWPKIQKILIKDQSLEQNNLFDNSKVSQDAQEIKLSIPPEGLNWKIVTDKTIYLAMQPSQVSYDKEGVPGAYGNIKFIGKEWILNVDEEDFDNIKIPDYLVNSGDFKPISNDGWMPELHYKDFVIRALQADGIASSSWGYVKLDGDKLSVLLFSRLTAFSNDDTFSCPCNEEYHIFLGNPIDINSALPK